MNISIKFIQIKMVYIRILILINTFYNNNNNNTAVY